MRKIVIIGGKLQGLEAVYLAQKAGLETVLIDKREATPASVLCDRFICADVLERPPELIAELKSADLVLPALENEQVLTTLDALAREQGFKLAFDLQAYLVSSSKLLSDKLMADNGIPAPRYYPDCKAPYIAKPSSASGSEGVRYVETAAEMAAFLKSVPENEEWVAQEFLAGRSYSIEVIGKPGKYKTYEVTEIHMDEAYDCKLVTAPCDIPGTMKKNFAEIAIALASVLQLNGIMDVEVIDDAGELKVLEIDARIPSQTPTVVYHATGVNFIEELFALLCPEASTRQPDCNMSGEPALKPEIKKYVAFEHLLVEAGRIKTAGEHIISQAGPLRLIKGFCGADEAITDHFAGSDVWRGTFITTAATLKQLKVKRQGLLQAINKLQGEQLEFIDLSPSYKNEH